MKGKFASRQLNFMHYHHLPSVQFLILRSPDAVLQYRVGQ